MGDFYYNEEEEAAYAAQEQAAQEMEYEIYEGWSAEAAEEAARQYEEWKNSIKPPYEIGDFPKPKDGYIPAVADDNTGRDK